MKSGLDIGCDLGHLRGNGNNPGQKGKIMKLTVVKKTDDLTEKEFTEGETITFAVQGKSYEIDLSKRNAANFYRSMGKYMDHAREVRAVRTHRVESNRTHQHETVATVRQWAHENGYTVAERGRIPQNVWDAYKNNHAE